MKRLTMILALLLMVAMPMMAERVSPETARKVATTFLNNNGAKSAQLTDLSKAAGFANLYIFTAEQGFVVMAADDCVKPILGYSLTGKFVVEGMPENVRGWLQGYDDEIQYAVDSKMKATAETAKMWKDLAEGNAKVGKATVEVDPLIQTKWNQNKYYNNLCPAVSDGPNGHAYTGCVATAMAQIMKYWSYPSTGIGSHSYTWNNQTLSANFGATTYDWEHMEPYYEYYHATGTSGETWLPANFHTTENVAAVATLMYHCGVSINMSYGGQSTGGSSASTPAVVDALKTYFNYSSEMAYKEKSDYSDADWISMVKAELDAHRPLQYRGSTGSGGGHSFVCDGYNSSDYFHFNWGWAGSLDGYFLLSNLNTGANIQSGAGNGNYTNNQAAIFGIQPATLGEAEAPTLTATLVQSTEIRNAELIWTAVSNAVSYNLYRNTDLVYSGSEMSYTDVHIPYGSTTYFVRSVDASGNLSWTSNYETITVTFAGPTNLTATQTDNGNVLTWTATENAVGYNAYCNGVLLASNINACAYIDSRTIAGTLDYYVKGVDALGDESDASNTATLSISYSYPFVNDLTATLSDDNATLSWTSPDWCYPKTPSATLTYGTQIKIGTYFPWNESSVYWGHRHLASSLTNYDGMKLYSVEFYVSEPGEYQICVYNGTTTGNYTCPQTFICNSPAAIVSSIGWYSIDLTTPIVIDATQDLWVFVHNPQPIAGLNSYLCTDSDQNAYGVYYSTDPISYTHNNAPGYAFLLKTYLTDGTYTYNLYQDGTSIAQNLSQTSYNATLRNNAANVFTVRTNYSGNETENSNKVGFTKGVASLGSLEMASNDKMTVTAGSELTVSEALTNTDPANLILENGAELVHNSANVKATVKKTITPPSNDDHGWYFIASPVTETVTPTADNGFLNGDAQSNTYDLYYYDEPTHYWKNYEKSAFNLLPQKGYLYANEAPNGTTLLFTGTLTPSNNSVTINGLSHSASSLNGFNLVGNPFACNATVNKDFYVVDNAMGKVILASNTAEIAPCAGIFVKATENDASVTFAKAASRVEPSSSSFDIVVKRAAQPTKDGVPTGSTTLDRARVHLSDAETLEKFSIGDGEGSVIYFPQNGQDLAVACANGENEMPLNFKTAKNGTYTLAFEVENLDLDYLHLIDNMTGNKVDVLAMPTYTFEAKTTDYASRFKLVFAEPTDGPSADDQPFAYYANGEIRIVADACDASLQVVDVTGRVVASVGGHTRCVPTTGMVPGVYVLRLINGNSVRTQKIVIE